MTPHLLALLLANAVATLLANPHPGPTQPEALLVFPGQTASLLCALKPDFAIRDHGVSWFQQYPGSAPRFLLYYYSEEEQNRQPGLPERFSASKDTAQNACILTISPVQPEDDADYYCSVSYGF
ncbi:pre-B lymphocyte protein 3-like [Phascolarctos cinereus]|uniref:Pre-B lymphocyte protein 3-like n=1 Tax=Phascolarctos cinereus TaxID=38626 RepID=A0A6P5JQJ8_PHACI|nr:pre-B lymphocyte protein 3-like [Phascolarctos cinereus]